MPINIKPGGGSGGGGSISVTDGVHTVNPASTVDFTSGATVTDAGGGQANVAITATAAALALTTIKTANYNAVVGDLVLCDTSGGAVTVTLPTAPANNSQVGVKQIAGVALLVAAGAGDIISDLGGSVAGIDFTEETVVFQYRSADSTWYANAIFLDPDAYKTSLQTTFDARYEHIISPTASKTANYAPNVGEFVICDTTGGAFTVTLPSNPIDGAVVGAQLNAGTNAVTIAAGAGDTLGAGNQTSVTTNRRYLLYFFRKSNRVWYGVQPLSNAVLSAGAFDTSIVAHGTATAVTFSTGTLDAIAAAQPAAGSVSFNSQKGTNVLDPTSAQDAATKNYVDTQFSAVNPAVAVTIATTAAADTSALTYANGVGGIGATLTGAVNTALTIDGVTLTSLNQRVLVKNDTVAPSGARNGVYYLTQLQTGILAPVLTRALDYDQPSDINSTGAIPVISGTANAGSSWLLTSTVATIGTDALTYTRFSYPATGTANAVLTTTGDMLYASAPNVLARLGVGSGSQVIGLSGGLPAWVAASGGGTGVFGDGSDGAVTFDGTTTVLGLAPASNTYTLTRDLFLADASAINNGVSIVTSGFRVFCAGTLTNNGTIKWDGAAPTTNTNAGQGASQNAASINQTSAQGTNGAAGGTGAGAAGTSQSNGGLGAAGGAGGTGTGGAGGAGGTVTAIQAKLGSIRSLPTAIIGFTLSAPTGGSGQFGIVAGAGGGAGGGDGANSGGGGGGGGGEVIVVSKAFAGTGAIHARGGAGGTATAGNVGGGGGGGGGWLVVVSQSVVSGAITGQTIDANGGAKGSPHGTGTDNAVAGSNGTVILLPN